MADVKIVPDPPPPPGSTIGDPLPEELPRPPAMPPDTIAPFTVECTPRDARIACNELAVAIELFTEEADHGNDVERCRRLVVAMRRIGDELDRIARAGGISLGRDWWRHE